jgi:HK97 family phage major capsid protein
MPCGRKRLTVCAAAPTGFTDEQRAQLKEHATELAQVEADIQILEAFLHEETSTAAPVAVEHVHQRATDIKGKKIYAKLSDQLVASGMRPTPDCDSMAPFASLSDQMRAVFIAESSRMTKVDPRLAAIQKIQAALGGNESVPAEGGFLVIPEFAQGLIKRVYDVALISGECFKMPMQSSRLIMHAVDEDSRVDGSRWGGILAYWLTEGGTYTPTKPKFREMQLVANKLIALSYATEEQLADGPAWEAYVTEAVPQELAFQIDTSVLSGGGAGQPLGILNSGALVVVAKDAGQATGTISTANILNMWSRMWARSRANAVWFINQDIEPQLIPLTLGAPSLAQILLYSAPGINGNPGPYGKMFGRPVIPIEQASSLSTQGDVILADMTQYILAQRADVRADTSIHVAFLTGEQAFRFMLRLDGQPTWKKPLTPYKGSATKSPFVTLATR